MRSDVKKSDPAGKDVDSSGVVSIPLMHMTRAHPDSYLGARADTGVLLHKSRATHIKLGPQEVGSNISSTRNDGLQIFSLWPPHLQYGSSDRCVRQRPNDAEAAIASQGSFLERLDARVPVWTGENGANIFGEKMHTFAVTLVCPKRLRIEKSIVGRIVPIDIRTFYEIRSHVSEHEVADNAAHDVGGPSKENA
jgi:hypothetical protein